MNILYTHFNVHTYRALHLESFCYLVKKAFFHAHLLKKRDIIPLEYCIRCYCAVTANTQKVAHLLVYIDMNWLAERVSQSAAISNILQHSLLIPMNNHWNASAVSKKNILISIRSQTLWHLNLISFQHLLTLCIVIPLWHRSTSHNMVLIGAI